MGRECTMALKCKFHVTRRKDLKSSDFYVTAMLSMFWDIDNAMFKLFFHFDDSILPITVRLCNNIRICCININANNRNEYIL